MKQKEDEIGTSALFAGFLFTFNYKKSLKTEVGIFWNKLKNVSGNVIVIL